MSRNQSAMCRRFRPALVAASWTFAVTASSFAGDSGAGTSPAAALVARIDAAVGAAANFLVGRQSADGGWRSDVYATFRGGDALSPHVLLGLGSVSRIGAVETAWRNGLAYLASPIQTDGTLRADRQHVSYPIYDAASAVIVLSKSGGPRQTARDGWLKYLRDRQLTDSLGWTISDSEYGGWSYAFEPPRKPVNSATGPPLGEPNLSATVFALEAIRAAGAGPDDPALPRARHFVRRCQNYPHGPPAAASPFDDGGFFFILGDAVRNKAGVAGRDGAGAERFYSYGSATADGLRALLLCGDDIDSLRVVAARRWLDEHFAEGTHPGAYAKDREHARQALYYYYARSQALAWSAIVARDPAAREKIAVQAKAMAQDLLKRQEPDGSWHNSAVDSREDDPLVATPFSVAALAACRTLVAVP
jgi:squalene-hopene/tetraprenyl-beta-curcumene cyclase